MSGLLDGKAGATSPQALCIDVSDQSRYLNQLCVDNIVINWKAGYLVGDPVLTFSVRWEAPAGTNGFNSGGLKGNGEGDKFSILVLSGPKSGPVIEALRAVRARELIMYGRVEIEKPKFENMTTQRFRELEAKYNSLVERRFRHSHLDLPIDAGALGPAGQQSFGAPSARSWNKMFVAADTCRPSQVYADAELARDVYAYGIKLTGFGVCEMKFAGLGEVDKALEQTCLAWRPTTESYRKCNLRCPEGSKPDSSGLKCVRKKVAKKPAQKADPAAQAMEEKLMAALGGKPAGAASGAATSGASGAGGTGGAKAIEDKLLSALGGTERKADLRSLETASRGSAPYGLTEKQWAQIQADREAEQKGLLPKWRSDQSSCGDDRPEAPEKPFSGVTLSLTASCFCPGGGSSPSCCPRSSASDKARAERRRREAREDYKDDLKRYKRNLARWEEARAQCLVRAEETHNKRIEDLAAKHRTDDKRLADIEAMRRELTGK